MVNSSSFSSFKIALKCRSFLFRYFILYLFSLECFCRAEFLHSALLVVLIFLVIMDIMLSQSCGKILVGDPHQQIYTFRGAVNALRTVPHTHIYYLTQVDKTLTRKLQMIFIKCASHTSATCLWINMYKYYHYYIFFIELQVWL